MYMLNGMSTFYKFHLVDYHGIFFLILFDEIFFVGIPEMLETVGKFTTFEGIWPIVYISQF